MKARVNIKYGTQQEFSIASMPPYSYGVTEDGLIYVRAAAAAVCINDPEKSYSGNANLITNTRIALLPPGTVITLTLEE